MFPWHWVAIEGCQNSDEWPRYLIQVRSNISSNSNVSFVLITSTKMCRNASVKEQKWNFVSERHWWLS